MRRYRIEERPEERLNAAAVPAMQQLPAGGGYAADQAGNAPALSSLMTVENTRM
jgi:hypothetical protein